MTSRFDNLVLANGSKLCEGGSGGDIKGSFDTGSSFLLKI